MTVREAFIETESRFCSLKVDQDRVIFYKGFKAIMYPNGEVKIFDTSVEGASYRELSSFQYSLVERLGFREAVKQLKSK